LSLSFPAYNKPHADRLVCKMHTFVALALVLVVHEDALEVAVVLVVLPLAAAWVVAAHLVVVARAAKMGYALG
jgi:hypothetical protein